MKIAQEEHYRGEDWWQWSVWIEAEPADLTHIEKVVWHLHPSFPETDIVRTNRAQKFRLDTEGWGTFRIRVDVVMTDGSKETLSHNLELTYPDSPSPRS